MTDLFGRLMIDIDGFDLSNEDKSLLSSKHIGGLILFSKNFNSYDQLYNLIKEVRSIKENIIIAVDQEGGRVQRFEKEFTNIPSMKEASLFAKENEDHGFIKDLAWLISSELIAVGIDVNFAPVLDINRNVSTIIGNRSFSGDILEVINNASDYIDGMHEAGMKSSGKHFPGHGNVIEDSHIELPEDERELPELMNEDIKPYIELRDKIDVIMCAHILFSKVDNKIPSFSDTWINNILRNKLNYKGLIFSDDLSMLGSGNENLTNKVKMSLDAGCDMLIICNDRSGVKKVIEYLDKNGYEQTSRIFEIKSFKKINWNDLLNNNRALETKEKLKSIRN
jgi:beta-N-acetylhexosaminidase